MKPHDRTSLNLCRRNSRFAARWLLSVLLSFAVLLGGANAGMAGQGANTSANWMEICGDGGSYFVQVGEDGQKQEPECAHCDYCLITAGDAPTFHSTQHGGLAPSYFSKISYLADLATLPESPEQYWSACRGPPIASIENKMTTNTSLNIKEPIGSVLAVWSIPCA